MRATEYLIIVVMIGVFAYLAISGAEKINTFYDTNSSINISSLSGYDKLDLIRNSTDDIYQNFQKLGAEDTSWFQKLGAGIIAIPYAVIKLPLMVVTAITALSEFITKGLGDNVPYIIILSSIIFLLIYAVREFLQFFQRSRS